MVSAAVSRSARRTQRIGVACWLALLAVVVYTAIEYRALHRELALNRALGRASVSALALENSPRGMLARAYRAQANDRLEDALAEYARVDGSHDVRVRDVIRFNLANLYLARAVELERTGDNPLSASLIEQAKQNYRDLLIRNPGHWDARYNLSRALQMLPDLDDVHYGNEINPERSPRSAQANTAYERLP